MSTACIFAENQSNLREVHLAQVAENLFSNQVLCISTELQTTVIRLLVLRMMLAGMSCLSSNSKGSDI